MKKKNIFPFFSLKEFCPSAYVSISLRSNFLAFYRNLNILWQFRQQKIFENNLQKCHSIGNPNFQNLIKRTFGPGKYFPRQRVSSHLSSVVSGGKCEMVKINLMKINFPSALGARCSRPAPKMTEDKRRRIN